jgi:hypothetical protein
VRRLDVGELKMADLLLALMPRRESARQRRLGSVMLLGLEHGCTKDGRREQHVRAFGIERDLPKPFLRLVQPAIHVRKFTLEPIAERACGVRAHGAQEPRGPTSGAAMNWTAFDAGQRIPQVKSLLASGHIR